MDDIDRRHLRRAVDLAAEAVAAGDEPFGSVLVAAAGVVRAEDRNPGRRRGRHAAHRAGARAVGGRAPAAGRAGRRDRLHLRRALPDVRGRARVGRAGRIVYATSAAQLAGWLAELGASAAPVPPLTVHVVAPGVRVDGPAPEFADEVRELHRRCHA